MEFYVQFIQETDIQIKLDSTVSRHNEVILLQKQCNSSKFMVRPRARISEQGQKLFLSGLCKILKQNRDRNYVYHRIHITVHVINLNAHFSLCLYNIKTILLLSCLLSLSFKPL